MLCPECSKPFKDSDKKFYHEMKGPAKAVSNKLKHAIKRGKDARGFRPIPAPNQLCFMRWLDKIDSRTIKILPCTKLMGVMEQVQDWIRIAPMTKSLSSHNFDIFRQWLAVCLRRRCSDLSISL
jgi:hypothetical protein